jgi:hypothetical protein
VDLKTIGVLLLVGLFLTVTGSVAAILWGKLTKPETFEKDDMLFFVKLFGAMGLLPLIFGILMKS